MLPGILQCGISNNNQCTDDHGRQIFYAKETGKKLTTGCKSGSCIRNKKDYDKNRSDGLQDLLLISVTVTEKDGSVMEFPATCV